jgi:predicted metal-binding membrane protein
MLTAVLRHDRYVVMAGLATIVALAWAWLSLGAGIGMEIMDMGSGQVIPMPPAWTPSYAALILVMWIVMMVAMMLPSAAPVILLVAALMRQGQGSRGQGATWLFALGYLAVWSAFSVVATALQWGLDSIGQLSETMASNNAMLAGGLAIVAGVYQWTPWKQACLRQCRSPLEWVTRDWRKGFFGPARAGARHGLFCLGCCWLLMALLFVFGLMNILWIAALAVLVFVEKVLPFGPRLSQATGVALVAWGVATLIR